jgi:hypothetical protein
MWKKLIRYLLSDPRDHIMSIFLGLLCIEVFIFGPLARAEGSMVVILNGIVFSSLLIIGVLAMTPTHIITQVASTAIIAMAITLRWMANLSGSSTLYLWDKFSSLAAALTFLALVLWQVYRESPVTVHKIRGAIAAYLLMAVIFAFLYNIIELVHPGSFTLAQPYGNLQYSQVEPFLYFSVSTLTTVGFGDITAVHPIARSLVMMESIIGILYPPVLIGVLVSLHIEWLREKSGKQG